jgi:hypothetical protein
LLAGTCLALSATGIARGRGPGAPLATGQITGLIIDAATSAPLGGIPLEAYTAAGSLAGLTSADAAGAFSIAGLATGSYYVRTRVLDTDNHIDEIYNDVPCPPCDVGTLIAVTDGVTTSGVNFALAPGGTISGTVTVAGTGAPIASMTVVVTTAAGLTMKKTVTNGAGVFVATGLPAGSYYARTSASTVQNYIDELYQERPCFPSCDMASGTAINVTVGGVAGGIAFTLAPGSTMTGTVTAAANGAPLAGISVGVYSASGTFVSSANTNAAGVFAVTRLAAGSFRARTELNGQNYQTSLFHGLACVGCDVTSGTPIAIAAGGTTNGVDFSLSPGGTMTGTVISSASGTPIGAIAIQVFAPNGAFVTRVHTTGAGAFIVTGLSTGSYFVRTVVADGQNYVNELYNNLPCSPDSSCTVTSGSPVAVAVGATTPGVDFSLASGGTITGAATDQSTGAFVSGVTVNVYGGTGVFIKSAQTGNDGTYVVTGLEAGSYYARTAVAPGQNYVDLLYNGLPCVGACPVTGGALITVTVGNTAAAVNFNLSPSGTITGTVIASIDGAPLGGLTLRAYTSTGILAATATSLASGAFSITGLPSGTYFVRTENTIGLIDELYNDVPCVGGCAVTTGAPITVTAGVVTSGVNMALAPGGRIAGRVSDATNGGSLAGITVGVYAANGAFATGAVTDGTGNYLTPTGLLTGTYYARTFNTVGYLNEIYDNQVFCSPNCLVTSGTAIVVTAGVTTPGRDFALAPGTELIRNGDFANGTAFWSLFATPDTSYLKWQIPDGAFQYYRALPPPGTSNQAVILQPTGAPVLAGRPLLAEFDLANTSSVRKRISVLIHDSDFSDLSVCTYWLPPNSPRLRYGMQTTGTKAWASATISFYAASADSAGGFYELDNVSLQALPGPSIARTSCLDPLAPPPPGGPDGAALLANGNFSTGTVTSWTLFGQIVDQVSAGVFEFYRPTTPIDPAGVILQPTGSARAAGEILTAQFDLGNSSPVRKRVTVLFHDLDFSDLSACTFWLAPNQPLSTYMMRSFTTKAWTNATISVYAATVGTETWTRLDNVSFRSTPGAATTGTVCVAPGG